MPIVKYLLVAFLLLDAVVLAGVLVGSRSARRWPSPLPWILGGVLVFLGVFVIDEIRTAQLEWNPMIPNDAAVVGAWQDLFHRMVLRADHTYSYHAFFRDDEGAWTRDDFNLRLHGRDHTGRMRFVQMHGQYRLMTNPPDDPDEWNRDIGLWHVQK